MIEKIEKKRLAILKILKKAKKPLGSLKITEQLLAMGYELSERTARFYLLTMDKEGLTENFGKKGRRITEHGLKELNTARAFEKVGFLSGKIDQMTYQMSFDLARKEGTVVFNLSILERRQLKPAIPLMCRVFTENYAMGHLMTLFNSNEKVSDVTIPEGKIGIGTVCSITLNGVLLQYGIPCQSRFGGLLEIQDKKPKRFVEIINYDGTSLDPLEVFIRSGMTDFTSITENGNARIGASFREVPSESRDKVLEIAHELEKIGLGGLLAVGWPGQTLLEIPVNEGMIGMIVIGGLNPVAVLEERGINVRFKALAGLADYRKLFHYQEIEKRISYLN
jgi:repressor of nif and glnA expression